MTITLAQVNWPIVLRQQNSSELLRLETMHDWLEQTGMLGVLTGSFIVDYSGNSYLIAEDSPIKIRLASPQLTLAELRQSVQQYASLNGHCCTSKLNLNTIAQLFDIVEFIEQS
ncbi:DUF4144 family protein [Shewanella sp. GutDb-MelDb]|uniref:DUF4144 family protein n=1 Tax=Shewanella sp. GutDb-MelDb TaxID=2058316 RepID=UPI000C7C77EA|nr:DUF4144 family protein [Shewanella sp. GutDb-MelDb]PKG56394.1 hypothetical protein CXF82_15040 [Shewanella sp. GutDb-MelDb]